MTITYEINPPRIPVEQNTLNALLERVESISTVCDGIHLTDSVLGIPRVSPLNIAKKIRETNQKIKLTCSLRVRDKELNTIEGIVKESIGIVDGVLILMGDKSNTNSYKTNLVSSQVVTSLNDKGFGKKLELFLSIPATPNFTKIQKKINAKPKGFFTQVVNSKAMVQRITDFLKPNGFRIIPCLLLPSEKNSKSAEFLKIDWSDYENNFIEFAHQIHELAGDILISSPNDFKGAHETLSKLAT
jgi:5,10-methylenetetrahydrofolate reductase